RQRLPISARPHTAVYRFQRFARRNWAALSATVAVITLLAAATGVALHQARIAARRYQAVRALATSILFDIHDRIRNLPGAAEARRVSVQKSVEYLDALHRESRKDVALQSELAAAYQRAGDILGDMSDAALEGAQSSLPLYEKALELRKEIAAHQP